MGFSLDCEAHVGFSAIIAESAEPGRHRSSRQWLLQVGIIVHATLIVIEGIRIDLNIWPFRPETQNPKP